MAEAVAVATVGAANEALVAAAVAVAPPLRTPRPEFPVTALGVGTPVSVGDQAQAGPDPGVPPSARVRSRLEGWRRIGASPWVVDTLTQGIYLPWTRTPPRLRSKRYAVAPADKDYLENESVRGLLRGFYRELTAEEAAQAHCIVGAFVVTSAGKQRMLIDYRHPNAYLADRRSKYESLFDLAPQLRPGDALLSWDTSDAFFSTWRSGRRTASSCALRRWGGCSNPSGCRSVCGWRRATGPRCAGRR